MGTLFLIPNTLGDTALETVIPSEVLRKIAAINTFASENPSNTRAFLKRITPQRTMDTVTFLEVNEHSTPEDYQACLEALARHDVGIISEAGCPGIADPGAEVVALAHQHNYPVVPLVGPSSILLALIASGFNGQNFSFNGYLPVKPEERARALRNYEKQSLLENRTQIFIETPYRNLKLFEQMLQVLHPETLLSIACDITTPMEYIRTYTIRNWKQQNPDINKRPAIFSIYCKPSSNTFHNKDAHFIQQPHGKSHQQKRKNIGSRRN